ncbi:Multidrug resistance protein MdtA [Pseudoalteromonas holothuriae]|uniref:Multidrug resistance protein MdtA n=1 Tax=Pseudoalteromonas holothuriae TaxID=2963714 RepID=A0ABN8UPX8_9GAMM|nr:efflux RND transporter periplasmic adaptor subunit [Pseudoalteromonas sp. CIP111951]CAH9065378.1 Multidrug resistance protein MdtA [Pseudoalteromonas sp. CIP111951]
MLLTDSSIKRIVLPILAILLLLSVVAYLAGAFNNRVLAGTKAQLAMYQGARYTVSNKQVAEHEVVNANVVAKVNTLVASRLLAQLKTLHVRAGETVYAGQLLATINDADLKARVSQVKAQKNAILAQLTQAKKQLLRSETLQNQGVVAVNEVDEWRTTVNELSAQKVALVQQLEGANAALSDTKILAPIDGTVVERLQEPGVMLTPSTPIVALYNPAQLQVNAAVREQYVNSLQLGDKLKIHIPASGMTQYANISEIVPVADSHARRFMIKLDIELAEGVKPGMYAQLYLPAVYQTRIVLPSKYIKRYGQLTVVEVVERGHVQRRFVRLGKTMGDQVEVLTGLSAGEELAAY